MIELLELLDNLTEKRILRQLDRQFADFIYQQSQDPALCFIAALVSGELGKGHSCLPIMSDYGKPTDFAAKLGVSGELANYIKQHINPLDWHSVLQGSHLVGQEGESCPLVFDGLRLYLYRYWHYETTLANTLKQYCSPAQIPHGGIEPSATLLNQLFARDYRYLHKAISNLDSSQQRPEQWQQLVSDHLDVVAPDNLDWLAINGLIETQPSVEQLSALTTLVPLEACVNWQKVAAAVALLQRFAVISGGPGTGKTTTVTKLLIALIAQAQSHGITPIIKLVAPTGKAAARLTEQMGKAVQVLAVSEQIKQGIPSEASTIHRLLGAVANSAEFKHHQHNPLHLDILVVDEASMVDLPMMYKLVTALPPKARLILLGDKDQLSSVDAGAVLGDICAFYDHGYSQQQGELMAQLTGYQTLANTNRGNSMADSLCMLQKSYRFDARSGIGQLAKAVNSGSIQNVQQVWQSDYADIRHFPLDKTHYNQLINTLVTEYQGYLNCLSDTAEQPQEIIEQQAKDALQAFSQCRLLCAVREGDYGVNGLNQRIERRLEQHQHINTHDDLWYHGRPIMVTRNDHSLGLYNGDIGICAFDTSITPAKLKVYFELPDGSIKAVLPSRVPEHDTAYAMTIHKSQGSEFRHTLMILPPEYSPILTRELIYTGITRAAKRLSMFSNPKVFNQGIVKTTERASGLVRKLKK